MPWLEWSTDALPEAERFSVWREELLAPLGITAEADPDLPGPFQARAWRRVKGPLQNVRVRADRQRVLRQPRDIARRVRDGYSVYREMGPGAWFACGGGEFVTRPGELVVTDANIPWESRTQAEHRLESILIPKSLLEPHLPALGRPLALRLFGRRGIEALATGYFSSLLQEWDGLDDMAIEAVADTFCRLLAIACGAVAGGHAEAIREARLAAAKRHIDRRLTEPDLSPASVAAALGISVRPLHLLFEPTDTSFTRHVTQRRLQECRTALCSPMAGRRSVIDIAFGWGFNNLATFYRAFHREFGSAPGECRAAAVRERDT